MLEWIKSKPDQYTKKSRNNKNMEIRTRRMEVHSDIFDIFNLFRFRCWFDLHLIYSEWRYLILLFGYFDGRDEKFDTIHWSNNRGNQQKTMYKRKRNKKKVWLRIRREVISNIQHTYNSTKYTVIAERTNQEKFEKLARKGNGRNTI